MGASGQPERLGKYTLVRRLAIGGMAEIFLARVRGLAGFERLVVVKQILPQYAADARFIRMLLQEARIAATLHHANVVQVLELDREGDVYFFAMDYVDGVDARRLSRAAETAARPIPLEHALRIVSGAAAGLHYAHEQTDGGDLPLGLVHRDVSPSNVLVGFDGSVKITDFGIAKATLQASDTTPNAVKGKLAYMSPEQCRGQPLDRRSDVFALGVVLFELTTGTRLFDGQSELAVLSQLLEQELPRPSRRRADYPAALEHVVLRALSRDPAARFATARELEEAIEEVARDGGLVMSQLALANYVTDLLGSERLAIDRSAPDRPATGTLGIDPPTGEPEPLGAATVKAKPALAVSAEARAGGRARRRRALLAGAVLALGAATVVAAYVHSNAAVTEPARDATTRPVQVLVPAPELAASPPSTRAVEPAAAAQPAPPPPHDQPSTPPPGPSTGHRPPIARPRAIAPRPAQPWNPDSPFAPARP
jgi:serine/threonine-protein kinase